MFSHRLSALCCDRPIRAAEQHRPRYEKNSRDVKPSANFRLALPIHLAQFLSTPGCRGIEGKPLNTRTSTVPNEHRPIGADSLMKSPHPLIAATVFVAAASALHSVALTWVAAWLVTAQLLVAARWQRPALTPLAALEGLVWGLGAAVLFESQSAAQGTVPFLVVITVSVLRGLTGAADIRVHLLFLACVCGPLLLLVARSADVLHLPAAAFVVLGALGAAASARALGRHAESAQAEQARRMAAQENEQNLREELQTLQLEARDAGAAQRTLIDELKAATDDLALLRSKTGALSSALQRVNTCDIETGLLNADKFTNVLAREWSRMQRQELPLSLLLVAVDRFDEFHDWHGAAAREFVLKRLADVLRTAGQRPGDVAARLGPSLFALLFPETEYKYVGRLADGVRARVRQLGIAAAPSSQHKVLTVTVGMATVIPNNDIEPAVLRERVEAALFEAQFQGGDRCVRYRSFESIRVEHWNPAQEGALTEDKLRHKLAILGYEAQPTVYRPGEEQASRRVPVDRVEVVVDGKLKIVLEGEARVLKPGDLLFIPKGLVISAEVVGQRPVRSLLAIRA